MSRPDHGRPGGRARRRRKRRLRLVRVQAKRLRRRLRRHDSHARWRAKPWWRRWPLEQMALEQGMAEAYPGFIRWRIGNALAYHGTVSRGPIAVERRLTILFPTRPSRGNPVVMADGPTTSRHRFRWARPTSLCLWYPGDHEQLRWTLPDGLLGLVDLSRVHLIKEIYWRVHDAWPGLEVHRDPTMSSASPRKRQLATRRQRCWCGKGRYVTCHGAVEPQVELADLRLLPATT